MMVYTVFVKPGSKKGPLIEPNDEGSFTIYVRERAVDGAANEAVIKLLAKHLGVPKTTLAMTNGHKGKIKTIKVL
jgi:hypothetical protein